MENNGIMTSDQIQKILPHRYPFLLVDKILSMDTTRVVAQKCVTINEYFFQGHFPGKAVMPGVLMIEALAQAGGVLMLSKNENHGKVAYLAAVNEVRFRRRVVPGDVLTLEVEIIKLKSKIGVMKGRASVGDDEACAAEIMFSLGDS